MATLPITNLPLAESDEEDISEEAITGESSDEDIAMPRFDLGDFDEDEGAESSDEEEITGPIKPIKPIVPTVPGAPRMQAQPILPTPKPMVLQLNIMAPKAPTPTLVAKLPALTPIPMAKLPTTVSPALTTLTTVSPTPIKTLPFAALPQLTGLLNPPKVTTPIAIKVPKQVDVATILAKMPNITIIGITQAPTPVRPDINDLLQKEAAETTDDFEARKRLTLKLAAIPDYKLNNVTAVTAAYIMMQKTKLGLTYDPDVEAAIAYLMALLQR